MPSSGEHGDDQGFGIGADGACPALESCGRPLCNEPMVAWHVFWQSVCTRTLIASLMNGDAHRAVEHLDDTTSDAHVDLFVEQSVWHGVEEIVDLDVIVGGDARKLPLRVLVLCGRQGLERWLLNVQEQRFSADAKAAHNVIIYTLYREFDCRVCFVEREERLMSQSAEDVGLRDSHSCFDLSFVPRPEGARRDRWMSRYSSPSTVRLTPGRLSSDASAAQSGSARCRNDFAEGPPNSRCSKISSLRSGSRGHASRAACARLRLS